MWYYLPTINPKMDNMIAFRQIGNTEYPRIQIDWKKLTYPLSSLALRVMTVAPIQTRMKIIPNILSDSLDD